MHIKQTIHHLWVVLVTLFAVVSFEARVADTWSVAYARSTVLARVRKARNYGKQMETD